MLILHYFTSFISAAEKETFKIVAFYTVVYPAPCLVYPHQLQGRFAALLVLYDYVIVCRSTNVCICTRRCCYRKCTQFVSYITYESTYII